MSTKESDLLFNKEHIKTYMRKRNERAADNFRHNFERMFGKTFGVHTNKTKRFK
jgi:hypothetical protein